MLEHVGRKSGRRRYVVLEVVDRGPDRYVVAAGFGENAQWLRNIDADPQVRVSVGTRVSAAATARRLSPAETAAALRSYSQRYPRAWRHLTPVFESTLGTRIDANGTTLPMVSLELSAA